MRKQVAVKDFLIGEDQPLTVISGPCVIESEQHCLECAASLKEMFEDLPVNFVFKSSFDKANRQGVTAFRGPGLKEGIRILQKVKEQLELPILSDIHEAHQASEVAEVLDIIQIPAMLCRQTDLILAAAKTGRAISLKKGQFMAPENMIRAVEKVTSTGNEKVFLLDRGTSFGYNNLVSDFRSIPIMQQFGYPVGFDASHSVQLPGAGLEGSSGGQRQFIPYLAKASVAVGGTVLYIESHPNPEQAKSDATTVMPFASLRTLIEECVKIHDVVREAPAMA